MKQKVPIVEQTGYHGYASNENPIPKRASKQRTTDVQTASQATSTRKRKQQVETTDDSEYQPQRMPTSSRTYIQPGQYTQGNTRFNVRYEPPPARPVPQKPQQRRREAERTTERVERQRFIPHWFLFVGLAMLIMVVGWVVLTAVGNWWNTTQDDLHYGRPRTYQIDAVVGHNNDNEATPSHFIALNLNRHVEVIELPGGDASHARIYLVVTVAGDNQDLIPVTLTFRDVNGDGKPDMLVHIGDQTIVYINDGTQFRPQQPGDHINV